MTARAPEFAIRQAHWQRDRDALMAVRTAVFVKEQGVALTLELDGHDAVALHLLAEDAQGRPIGTARLLPDGRIGRMAVLPHWRRRGVGGALLRESLRLATDSPGMCPFLNAQRDAVGFYLRHGFVPEGEEFLEAGIPHRRMRPGDSP